MRLRLTSITGADDSTPPASLAALSAEFPFVEWGLLLSRRPGPRTEFPGRVWLAEVERLSSRDGQPSMQVAGHVCGAAAVRFCTHAEFLPDADRSMFRWVQLNVSDVVHKVRDLEKTASGLPPGREYIVQVGDCHGEGLALARAFAARGVSVSVLFDRSGGEGLRAASWPALEADLPCGFAGGLGPDTLADDLARLQDQVGNATVWIDMQKRVRSDDGARLDLDRVRRCLEIAQPHAA